MVLLFCAVRRRFAGLRGALFTPALSLGLVGLLLAACQTGAPGVSRYEPPETPGGRLCVAQCHQAQLRCREECELSNRLCSNLVQAQAIHDYEQYAREQLKARATFDLRPRDFERPDACGIARCFRDCENGYRLCYEQCGGRVVSSSP